MDCRFICLSDGWHKRNVCRRADHACHAFNSRSRRLCLMHASSVPTQHQGAQQPKEAGAQQAPLTEEEQAKRKRLWMAAIKPPMYSVGIVPVLVAGAAVFLQAGTVSVLRLTGFVFAAILVIAWLNLSNDAFDAQTGVDESKPESIVNLTGNQPFVFWMSVAFLMAGGGLLLHLLGASGDWRPTAMLAMSLACGYMYQGPPFRLSYKGLGEPLCLLAFGPLATNAFYLAMQPVSSTAGVLPSLPPLIWALSVLVGITTTVILFTSHFHQIAGDTAAGKRSPLVRLGAVRGLTVLKASVAAVYGLALLAGCTGALPLMALLPTLASAPAAKALIGFAQANHLVPAKITPLKKFACMWHIAFGCSLSVGLIAARLATGPG